MPDPTAPSVTLLDPQGTPREVPADTVEAALSRGWRPQTHADVIGAASEAANATDYGGVHGAIGAIGAGALRGATLGASDIAARAIGGDEAAATLSGLRAENPVLSTGSELAGALAPAIMSGGASLPASFAGRAGAAVAEDLGGGLLARAAGGAAEGALFGAGAGASELALSSDPLTVEHVTSALSSNILFGGLVGGVAGLSGAAVEKGLARAKGAIDARLARPVAEQLAPDIANMSARDLGPAIKAERDAIDLARQPERDAFVGDLRNHTADTAAEQTWGYTSKHSSSYVRGLGVESRAADNKVRFLLRNEAELARNPKVALRALEEQSQALGKINDAAVEEQVAFRASFRDAPTTIRQEILDNKIKGMVVGKGGLSPTSPVIDQEVDRIMQARYGTTDPAGTPVWPDKLAARFDAAANAGGALTRVDDLIAKVKRITAEPFSERLSQLEAAKAELAMPREKSLGETVFHAIPFAGRMAEIASAGGKVTGALRAAGAKAAQRLGEAASSFLGVAEKGAKAAGPALPIAATKFLGAVRYAPEAPELAPAPTPKGKTTLAHVYQARTDEIKTQTAYDAAGVPRVRPAARAAIGARLKPIAVADPILADRMETDAVRRLEYLSSLIPRRPGIAGVQVGPDHWQPSDMKMRSFARSAAAVEDPYAVLERAAHGSVTPEDVDAVRAMAPEMLRDFISRVTPELPSLRQSLPIARQTALSILTGEAINPAMDPAILSVLQAQYQYGDEGGARAQPQFGSVKNRAEVGTAVQRREEGTK